MVWFVINDLALTVVFGPVVPTVDFVLDLDEEHEHHGEEVAAAGNDNDDLNHFQEEAAEQEPVYLLIINYLESLRSSWIISDKSLLESTS